MRGYEQLTLPIPARPREQISWYNVEQYKKRRFLGLLGHKMVTRLIEDETTKMPRKTTIEVEDIDTLKDPNLRYALRFAVAASAAGWIEESPHHYSSYSVSVEATDEGRDSRLVAAYYSDTDSGQPNTFVENLKRLVPIAANENHRD